MKRYIESSECILAASRRIDTYLKSELRTARDLISQQRKNVEIADDYESITFESKSGNKLTVRVKRVLVPEYHVLDDFGNEIYVSTDPQPDAIAKEIFDEYNNN